MATQFKEPICIQAPYGREISEYHGTVFSGEAPESDDEIFAYSNVKLGTAKEVTEVYKPSPTRIPYRHSSEEKSILQKLLGNSTLTY